MIVGAACHAASQPQAQHCCHIPADRSCSSDRTWAESTARSPTDRRTPLSARNRSRGRVVTRSWLDGRHGDVVDWRCRAVKQLRVGGRDVPLALTVSVLCWLLPGAWTGLGALIPSFFMSPEMRDSGWFGSGTLAVLAAYTAIVMGVPVLMLYRSRMARAALTVVAAYFTAAIISAQALAPVPAYIPVLVGAVLMWHPHSNRYLQKPVPTEPGPFTRRLQNSEPGASRMGCNVVESPQCQHPQLHWKYRTDIRIKVCCGRNHRAPRDRCGYLSSVGPDLAGAGRGRLPLSGPGLL